MPVFIVELEDGARVLVQAATSENIDRALREYQISGRVKGAPQLLSQALVVPLQEDDQKAIRYALALAILKDNREIVLANLELGWYTKMQCEANRWKSAGDLLLRSYSVWDADLFHEIAEAIKKSANLAVATI